MTNTDVKFPHVHVRLSDNDGTYAILGACQEAARKAKVSQAHIDAFLEEATSGDYDHLLQTCCTYFQVR